MGAGQIGGIASLLDIDFNNAAGFVGMKAEVTEAQYMVYYFSHAMLFCAGALIEPHVILTPASCVFGERYKFDVYAGTHKFLENAGAYRQVQHICVHKGYNHTRRWTECSTDNLALLILNKQFSFHSREPRSDFVINRVRYGLSAVGEDKRVDDTSCRYYGWGSRRNMSIGQCTVLKTVIGYDAKVYYPFLVPNNLDCFRAISCNNCCSTKDPPFHSYDERLPTSVVTTMTGHEGGNGYLIPLLIELRRVNIKILPADKCIQMWNYNSKFLCVQQQPCKSEKFGALCPDDLGSVIVCSGFVQGMMTSRLVDRPCGVGFIDLQKFSKFLMCGVDESRDVVDHEALMTFDYTPFRVPSTPTVITPPPRRNRTETTTVRDKKTTSKTSH